jgi:hypothetical protein
MAKANVPTKADGYYAEALLKSSCIQAAGRIVSSRVGPGIGAAAAAEEVALLAYRLYDKYVQDARMRGKGD